MNKLLSYEDLRQYAKVLLWALDSQKSDGLKNKDIIIIKYDYLATPLAEALLRCSLKTFTSSHEPD